MARGRMLSTEASTDPDLNAISADAALLYLFTLPHLDRDGLIDGRPGVIFSRAIPLRFDLLDKTPSLINEWKAQRLVIAYEWKDGPILFFKGFRKHNSGLDYAKEPASKFPPPPGWHRSKEGLIPDDEEASFRLAQNFKSTSLYAQALKSYAEKKRKDIETTSGRVREHFGKSSRKVQDEDQDQTEDQEQDQDQEKFGGVVGNNHTSHLSVNGGVWGGEIPPSHRRDWTLDHMKALGWAQRNRYYDSLDAEGQILLTEWIFFHWFRTSEQRQFPILARGTQWEDLPYHLAELENPFSEIENPAGYIRWNVTEGNPADLHPDEIRILIRELQPSDEVILFSKED